MVKPTEYIKIDIFELIKPLAHGQTIEIVVQITICLTLFLTITIFF